MPQPELSAIHLPNYSHGNPYLENLSDGIESNGVDVTVVGDGSTYIFSLLRASRTADIVHVHWLEGLYKGSGTHETLIKSLLLPIDLLLAQLLGVTVVWTVHNVKPHEAAYPQLYGALGHLVSRVATAIHVHDESTVNEIVDAYRLPSSIRQKCEVVPHGNYIENYPNNVDQEEARSELDIDSDETVYLFLGLIRPYKGVPEVIEAFTALDEEDSRLIIAGKPDSEDYDRQLSRLVSADDRIEYRPEFIPEDKLQLYFNAADVAVFPFRSVLTSGSVLLSLSFGCPTVVPRIGNVGKLSQGTVSYDPDDETVLDGIQRATNADLTELGDEAQAFAESVDWDSIGEQMVSVYQRSLSADRQKA